MLLTNGELFQAREPFQKLLTERMPVAVSYKLAKLVNKLNDQLKIIEDVRAGLIRKYGKPDKTGTLSVEQNSKEWPKFAEEFNELMAQEAEIDITPVKLPERVEGKEFAVPPVILVALSKFVEV